MIRLHINIDHVATLRNQRDTAYPDPLEAARICLDAGAHGITVHLREDRRHIRDEDVRALRRGPLAPGGAAKLNLEMAATQAMADIAVSVRPDVVTLVPERREERTTEGGLDVVGQMQPISAVVQACKAAGIKVSLFIEGSLEQVRASAQLGVEQVEFHTGHYCDAPVAERAPLLERLRQASVLAHECGLEVAAGHGLNRENVGPIVELPHLVELNIGHSVIADAVFSGLSESVRALYRAIQAAGRGD